MDQDDDDTDLEVEEVSVKDTARGARTTNFDRDVIAPKVRYLFDPLLLRTLIAVFRPRLQLARLLSLRTGRSKRIAGLGVHRHELVAKALRSQATLRGLLLPQPMRRPGPMTVDGEPRHRKDPKALA